MLLPTLATNDNFRPVTDSKINDKFRSSTSRTTDISQLTSLSSQTEGKNQSSPTTFLSSFTTQSTSLTTPSTTTTTLTSTTSSSRSSTIETILASKTSDLTTLSTRRPLKSFSVPANFNKSVYIAPRKGHGRQLDLLGGAGGLGALGALSGLGSLGSLGLFGGNSGGTNAQQPLSILENLIPLLGFLPLEQLFPGSNAQDNYIIMSSLPMVINIINSLTKFDFQVRLYE
jgi:hypothetical protein